MRQAIIHASQVNLGLFRLLLDGVPDDKKTHQPAGINNHPVWQVGHLATSANSAGKLLGLDPLVSEAYPGLYGIGSEPVDDPSKYASREELMSLCERNYAEVYTAFESASDDVLAADLPTDRLKERFGTTGNFVTFLLTAHIGFHAGQLSSWRRAIGLGSVL